MASKQRLKIIFFILFAASIIFTITLSPHGPAWKKPVAYIATGIFGFIFLAIAMVGKKKAM
jgi:hypothetical protein